MPKSEKKAAGALSVLPQEYWVPFVLVTTLFALWGFTNIANSSIGGIVEATACEDQFRRENVGVSLAVAPCWCYRSETMDMDPLRPKAVFGFHGTERPGAVYLAAVPAGHTQKAIFAFGIYGRDVHRPRSDGR